MAILILLPIILIWELNPILKRMNFWMPLPIGKMLDTKKKKLKIKTKHSIFFII